MPFFLHQPAPLPMKNVKFPKNDHILSKFQCRSSSYDADSYIPSVKLRTENLVNVSVRRSPRPPISPNFEHNYRLDTAFDTCRHQGGYCRIRLERVTFADDAVSEHVSYSQSFYVM